MMFSSTVNVDAALLVLLPQLHSVLWVSGTSCLYTLTSSRLSKWEVDNNYEHQILSWDVQRALTESITDAIWVSAIEKTEIVFHT